eukprot:scaffold106019_cov25-Tisochrysis_lutea.AAC.1
MAAGPCLVGCHSTDDDSTDDDSTSADGSSTADLHSAYVFFPRSETGWTCRRGISKKKKAQQRSPRLTRFTKGDVVSRSVATATQAICPSGHYWTT